MKTTSQESLPPTFSSSTTPFAAIAHHGRATPEKTAVICGNQALTYAQLAAQIAKVAEKLRARGICPGERVAVDTDRAIEHLIGAVAAMAAGAIAVALPTDPTSRRAIIADSKPAAVVVPKPADGSVKDVDAASPSALLQVDGFLEGPEAWDQSVLNRAVRPEEIAMLYYTSGTSSGVRKGVMQSYGQLHNTVHYITQVMRMDSSVCEFVATPTDNAFWFGRCRCIFHVGGTALLSSGVLNPLSIVSALNRHGGNAIAGDTAVFLLLLHHMEKYLVRLGPAIRWMKIASAPMPIEDKRRIIEILPQARIVMNYGLTEAMRTCLLPFEDSPEKLESVGRPSPSVSIRVVDSEGRDLRPREVGEILINGGNLASGYWRKKDLWAKRFRNGWYHSGDLGCMDEDGFVYLRGRIDHAINSGGKTIALSEVDDLLRPFLRHTTYATCGMNDPRGVLGDVVVLCVEGAWNEPIPWNTMRIRLFEAMEPLLVPIAAYVVPEFPRTSNQKIQLNVLRQRLDDGQGKAL